VARDLKPVYTAASEAAALDAFAEFSGTWEARYPAIVRLWENAWAEFVPFLAFDREIRTIICTTNAIESLNARFRRSVNARGHFPTELAALKHLYLVIISLDPTGRGRKRWSNRWLSRPGARCWHCCRSVSPGRSPNPACASRRTGLSTVSAVRRGSPLPRGPGSRPGSGNG
jgi:Transposase, Mutator family